MLIRDADTERDAAACAAIYAPYVADTVISFEYEAPTAAQMAERIDRLTNTHAWLVAEDEGEVFGYAYGCPHRERAAYQWATEVSVYVDRRYHRRGAGRALYGALFDRLAEKGYRIALGGIALPNEASVRLHKAFGFTPVGVYKGIGYKQDAWWDVEWWQLELESRQPASRQPANRQDPSAG
jgi:phosphinothricin acetyltransferase